MSFTSDMFAGLAQVLVDAGVGSYSPTTAYAPTDTAIVSKVLPADPDNAIALTFYPVSDDATLGDSVIGIQVMTRAAGTNADAVDALDDAVFAAFQSLPDQTLSTGIDVLIIERRSGTSMGKDDVQRWMRSSNYYAQVYRPATHRL